MVFFLTKVMQRKLIIFYALIFIGGFMFLSGPSYVFGLYDNESSMNKTADHGLMTVGNVYTFKL